MNVYLEISTDNRIFLGSFPLESVDEISLPLLGESELSEFFKILDQDDVTFTPNSYKRLCSTLNLEGKYAFQAIPKNKLVSFALESMTSLQNALCGTADQEYLVTYLIVKRMLQRLNRAFTDKNKVDSLITNAEHETTKRSLMSFLPTSTGECESVEYSMTNSATGRLTVKSGPQILTIPSQARQCLESRYPRGKVLQIDIVSAEPKFALHLRGIKPPRDVYTHIAKELLKSEVSRDQAKLITLCALYGQSIKKLSEKLPPSVGARGVIQKTKEYFDSQFLMSRLKAERKSGKIRNAVGRPLLIPDGNPHLLVSYYLQSSVAEGSILMFSRFMEQTDLVCQPLFVIHDALIIDCDEESAIHLLSKEDFHLSLGDWKFDAEVKHVGE